MSGSCSWSQKPLNRTRSLRPSASTIRRSSASYGPEPWRSSSTVPGSAANASSTTCTPFRCSSLPTYPTRNGPSIRSSTRGAKRSMSTPSPMTLTSPLNPLERENVGGRPVAAVRASCCLRRGALDPTKRRREALLDVLGPVEENLRSPPSAKGPKHQEFGRGQAGGFLVDVEDVDRSRPQRPPNRPGVVHEHVGMAAERSRWQHEGVVARIQRDDRSALVPPPRAHQRDIVPRGAQPPIALPPRADHRRVINPHHSHADTWATSSSRAISLLHSSSATLAGPTDPSRRRTFASAI